MQGRHCKTNDADKIQQIDNRMTICKCIPTYSIQLFLLLFFTCKRCLPQLFQVLCYTLFFTKKTPTFLNTVFSDVFTYSTDFLHPPPNHRYISILFCPHPEGHTWSIQMQEICHSRNIPNRTILRSQIHTDY